MNNLISNLVEALREELKQYGEMLAVLDQQQSSVVQRRTKKDPPDKGGWNVFHTYSSYARGLDILVGTYNFLDTTPKGRDEDGLRHPAARQDLFAAEDEQHDGQGQGQSLPLGEIPGVAVGRKAGQGACGGKKGRIKSAVTSAPAHGRTPRMPPGRSVRTIASSENTATSR